MNAELTANLGPVRQLGYVVADIDAAVDAWQRALTIGPWTILRNITLDCVYRGESCAPQIDIALTYRGDQQIELIQQNNAAVSPYLQCIEESRHGLHHIAFLCTDIDADVRTLQARGLNLACDIRMPGPGGGRYVYFDSPVPGENSYIELLQATAVMRTMFADGIAQARQWEGSGRPMDLNLGPVLRMMRGVQRFFGGRR